MYVCMHVCTYACMYARNIGPYVRCMYICTYVRMYICMHVCMYVFTVHICILKSKLICSEHLYCTYIYCCAHVYDDVSICMMYIHTYTPSSHKVPILTSFVQPVFCDLQDLPFEKGDHLTITSASRVSYHCVTWGCH